MDVLKSLISEKIANQSRSPDPLCFDLIASKMREDEELFLLFNEIENGASLERDDFWAFCETILIPVQDQTSAPEEERVITVSEDGFYVPDVTKLKSIIRKKMETLTKQPTVPDLIRKHEQKTGKRAKDMDGPKTINMSKQLYSAIFSHQTRYSKWSLIRLAIGFEMSFQEAEEFLAAAGYAFNLTKSDIIIRTCLEEHCYDVPEIDDILYSYKLQTLNPDRESQNE